jgi:hypothetical protein
MVSVDESDGAGRLVPVAADRLHLAAMPFSASSLRALAFFRGRLIAGGHLDEKQLAGLSEDEFVEIRRDASLFSSPRWASKKGRQSPALWDRRRSLTALGTIRLRRVTSPPAP